MPPNQLTSEEKFWAVLSHLSALAGGVGMIIPTYGWIENRKKSAYAAFQSLQALGYQSLGYTLWAVFYLLVLVILFIVTVPMLVQDVQKGGTVAGWLGAHALLAFGLFAIYLLFPIVGAVRCGLGSDFNYPILGSRLARYLGYRPAADAQLDEARADRFAVSMGHFGVIFPLWGTFVPIVLLTTQGARSRFVKFQALQTIVFQVASMLISLVLGLIAFAVLAAALVPLMVNHNPGDTSIESLLGGMVFLICLGGVVMIVPLFQILGQWAGLRILQGYDYRYPVIGRLVENWLEKREAATVSREQMSK